MVSQNRTHDAQGRGAGRTQQRTEVRQLAFQLGWDALTLLAETRRRGLPARDYSGASGGAAVLLSLES
ncbi:MAG: hypothetical protein RLZZ387_5084 [Chloroflexota bacterium]